MQGTTYQSITLVLAAGESRSLVAYGNYFRILDNSISTHPLVRIGGESEQEFQAGVGIDLPASSDSFIQIMVRNPALVSMTLKVAIASGKVDDSRLSLTGSVNTIEQPINTLGSPAAITIDATGTLTAADATIRERVLQNNGAKSIWIGATLATTDPAANRGIKIAAGGSFVLSCCSDFAAKCAAGETSTLSILNISKV